MDINPLIIHDKDGISWHEAPKPFWLHRCRPQTYGYIGSDRVDKCACGGFRFNGEAWTARNTRRK